MSNFRSRLPFPALSAASSHHLCSQKLQITFKKDNAWMYYCQTGRKFKQGVRATRRTGEGRNARVCSAITSLRTSLALPACAMPGLFRRLINLRCVSCNLSLCCLFDSLPSRPFTRPLHVYRKIHKRVWLRSFQAANSRQNRCVSKCEVCFLYRVCFENRRSVTV